MTYESLPFFTLDDALRSELGDERCTVRRDAAWEVERRVSAKNVSLIEALRRLHHAPSSSEHVKAIQIALGEIGESTIVAPVLRAFVESPYWFEGFGTILLRLQERGVMPYVFEPGMIRNADRATTVGLNPKLDQDHLKNVKQLRSLALGELQRFRAVTELCDLLAGWQKDIYKADEPLSEIICCLAEIGDPACIEEVRKLLDWGRSRTLNWDHFGWKRPSFMSAASDLLARLDRLGAAVDAVISGAPADWAWKELKSHRMVTELSRILTDFRVSRRIRARAADALSEFTDEPPAVEALFRALTPVADNEGSPRWPLDLETPEACHRALKRCRSANATGIAILALGHERCLFCRCVAAEVLGRIGNSGALDPLLSALSDSDSVLRGDVIRALGELGNPMAIEALLERYRTEEMHIRSFAAEAINKIATRTLDGCSQNLVQQLSELEDTTLEWGNSIQGGGSAGIHFAEARDAARRELKERGLSGLVSKGGS